MVTTLNSEIGGIIIKPFEISGLENNISGTSISQLLYYDIYNISDISNKADAIQIPTDITLGIPLYNRAAGYFAVPEINEIEYTTVGTTVGTTFIPSQYDIILTNIGPIGLRDTSLGNLLLCVKSLFGTDSSSTITGSLQKYNSTIVLAASLEDSANPRLTSWEIKTINENPSMVEPVPSMVNDLAFCIAFHYLSGNEKSLKDLPRNWQALKYLIQGRDAYISYNMTGDITDLKKARDYAILSSQTDRSYMQPIQLLSDISFFLIKEKRNQEAKQIFQSITFSDPINSNIGLGLAYASEGNYARAIAAYDRALKADPNNICALNCRGVAMAALRQYAKAIQDYDAAIWIYPSYPVLWINKGAALNELNKTTEADMAFVKANELEDN